MRPSCFGRPVSLAHSDQLGQPAERRFGLSSSLPYDLL